MDHGPGEGFPANGDHSVAWAEWDNDLLKLEIKMT
jgi:hypothetical protein